MRETERLRYPVAEAAHLLGIGTSKLYELVSEGRITLTHIGRSSGVTRAEIERFLSSLEEVRDARG